MATNTLKVLLVGDGGCGKSSLLKRLGPVLLRGTTLGVYIQDITFQTSIGLIDLQVWDVSGTYPGLMEGYCVGTNGVVYMFDLSRPETEGHMMQWRTRVENVCGNNLSFVTCGNKSDLVHDTPHMDHAITSCKLQSNISLPFLRLIRKMLNNPTIDFL